MQFYTIDEVISLNKAPFKLRRTKCLSMLSEGHCKSEKTEGGE